MVIKISKNLEMKSLLPTPRSRTSFSPHVLAFPLRSPCSLYVLPVPESISLQDVLHFHLIRILVLKHQRYVLGMYLSHVHLEPLLQNVFEMKLVLSSEAAVGPGCHLLPSTPCVHQHYLLSHSKLHPAMHTVIIAIPKRSFPIAPLTTSMIPSQSCVCTRLVVDQ
jgi:hypothetical protein